MQLSRNSLSLEYLAAHLKGKVLILGIGNTLKNDDAAGSILASRLKEKLSCLVYDVGASPENYLGKIIKDKPNTIVIVDAVDFGAKPGESAVIEASDIKTTNLFSTHNASISLTINYLLNHFEANIMLLAIQPKDIGFGDKLSPEITETITKLEHWFYETIR
ncbi:MAG: hydrogenase 3 maturation endopeptidase HyCI [Candidatus Omnitrophica bacterium]|nr:hydrogenase 3 maturation endopeptidase HyCI [Candidatus Omnitrophota bacterium]